MIDRFSKKETVMAWLAALVGYLFCRTFWIWQKPFVGLVFAFCLFTFAFVFFKGNRRKTRSWFYPITALVLSLSLFLSAGPLLQLCVFAYICIAFLMFCQTGSAMALEDRAGQLYVFETVKAIIISPFRNFGASVGAISTQKGSKKVGKTLLYILIGIGLAVVPTFIVMQLLSFDSNFTVILDGIRQAVFDRFFSYIWSLIFGVPIGMYVYAALYVSAHPVPDRFSREYSIYQVNRLKFAPALVGAVAVTPLLFLYGVFIAAQFDYYKAIFMATLPAAYTFAAFARDGFFRLCVVAAINAMALIVLRVFSKKTEGERISPIVKIFTVILSLVTIVISGTAISQMIMYVSAYGLTRLRLYTLWFMGLLILMFVLTILKQFSEKIPFASSAIVIFVLCFGILTLPDTDAIIARHNYNCYLAGTTSELDTEYLGDLSPSSIPVLCEIAENSKLSDEIRKTALNEIKRFATSTEKLYNLPTIFAEKAYEELNDDLK